MNNIYYSPEKFGFKVFNSIDTAGSYEFDIFLILENLGNGRLYWTTDSGCSCPTPFEDVGVDGLHEITISHFKGFTDAITNHYNINKFDAQNIINEVRSHLAILG